MILQVILPLIFLMLMGYGSVYFQLLNQEHIQALNHFVIKIALPAFLFCALSSKNIQDLWHPAYFIAYGGGSLLMFLLAYGMYWRGLGFNLSQSAVMSMGASMSNTGFMGTAILTMLLAEHAAVYISLTLIIENMLIILLMLSLAELGLQQGSVGQVLQLTLKRVCKNPLIIAIILGLSLALCGWHLPVPIATALELVGKTASPLALLVIGASMATLPAMQINRASLLLVSMSCVLMPALIYGLFLLIPGTSAEMRYAGTLIAALPMPTAFAIFAQAYGLHDKALTPLMLSNLVGMVGVSGLIYCWY
jgi:malonate transporter